MIIRKLILYFYFILIPHASPITKSLAHPKIFWIKTFRTDFDSLNALKDDAAKRKLNEKL